MASTANFVVRTCRFFIRHPARILFIVLLILFILLSRIIHTSQPGGNGSPRYPYSQNEKWKTLDEVGTNSQKLTPKTRSKTEDRGYNVLMTLVKVGMTSPLARSFRRCVNSICAHTTIPLAFHVVVDDLGRITTQDAFKIANQTCKHNLTVTYYTIEQAVGKVSAYTKDLQRLFSSDSQSYFSHPVFFISVAIHFVLPQSISKIIMLDSDLQFRSDIGELFQHFGQFDMSNIFGLAQEQQPVYRHIFHMYRKENPNTRVGGPPPGGLTGFNSGVLLIDLHRMRKSHLYKQILTGDIVKGIAQQYQFQGHLGDQDFYTLLGIKYEELFYTLPCSWNRQLCTWWRDNGYSEVFQLYYNCSGPVHVYHGNCRTPIPET